MTGRLVMLGLVLALASAPAAAQPEITPEEVFDIAVTGLGSPYVWGGGC